MERLENNGIPIHAVAGTNKRWDEMCWKLEQVKDYISRKKTFYETEKNVAASQDIPADRLAEFNEIFQTFDTDMSSALQLRDFANCIKGLGIEVSPPLPPPPKRDALEGPCTAGGGAGAPPSSRSNV